MKIPAILLTALLTTSVSVAQAPEPLRIAGAGVGYGGFFEIGAWLADELAAWEEKPRVWINYYHSGTYFKNGLLLLESGEADICLVNSRGLAAMALRGRGVFQRSIPVRAIAALPQRDWCLLAVDADLEVASLAAVADRRMPLTFTTGFLDEVVGFLFFEVLQGHGINPEEFRSWGGRFRQGVPPETREDVRQGRADAVFQEGAYNQAWQEIIKQRPLNFLSLDPAVARRIREELGWPSVTVPAGYLPGQDEPVLALDFSDWIICVREDSDEEFAGRLAQIVVEKSGQLRHDGLDLPLDLERAIQTSIPLHRGARRYYEQISALPVP